MRRPAALFPIALALGGDDRAFQEGGAQWLVCTIIIQRSVTPSGWWR
jgi:hypothetical protein